MLDVVAGRCDRVASNQPPSANHKEAVVVEFESVPLYTRLWR